MSRNPDVGEAIFDGDEELAHIQQSGLENGAAAGETELVPYAHRDLKPGYVCSPSFDLGISPCLGT